MTTSVIAHSGVSRRFSTVIAKSLEPSRPPKHFSPRPPPPPLPARPLRKGLSEGRREGRRVRQQTSKRTRSVAGLGPELYQAGPASGKRRTVLSPSRAGIAETETAFIAYVKNLLL